MMLVKNSITVHTNVKRLFDFLADPRNLPLWNYYVKKVNKLSSDEGITGTRFQQIRKNDEQVFEISAFEQNKLIEFTTIPGSRVQFKRMITFQGKNGQTLLDDHFELDTGHPGFIQKLVRKRIKKAVMENLTKLKQLVETGQTTLQDGRKAEMID